MIEDIELTRRTALSAAAAAGVALFAPSGSQAAVAVPIGVGRARFLSAAELRRLAAVVDRVVPGVPEDSVPGAVAAGCHEAIDALLAAFQTDPPRIYAGGPFSDRGGAEQNDFAQFLPLDRYESKAWRLRLHGSRGRPALERNGPVPGYRHIYRQGLAALEEAAPGFDDLPGPARDLVLRTTDDPRVEALLDLAVPHTLEFLYGAPEYGGNRDLLGWRTTGFEGDTQPGGYTRDQVLEPESSGPLDLVTDLLGLDAAPVLALASPEALHGVLARSGGRYAALRDEVTRLTSASPDVSAPLARMQAMAASLVEQVQENGR